jgi:NitT/TauT family transport system permease protein
MSSRTVFTPFSGLEPDISPRWITYGSVVFGVVFLELIARLGLVGTTTLIPLSEIAVLMVENLLNGTFTPHIIQTGGAVLAGFGLGIASGFPIGLVLWRYDVLGEISDPFLLSLYAVPLYIFYPIFIIVFGLNIIPIIIIAWIMSTISIIENVRAGFSEVPEVYKKVGKVNGLGRLATFRHIYLPAATPQIFTGLKLGFIYALIGTIASEFILADRGLGFLVSYSYNQFSTGMMYASMALIIVIAIVMNGLLLAIETYLERWRVEG